MEPTKTYLRRIRQKQHEILLLTERCNELRFSLGASAIRYDKDNVQTSPRDTTSEIMCELFEIQDHITGLMRFVDLRRFMAFQILGYITDQTLRDVIRLYYLESCGGRLYTWDMVASKIGKSTKYVIRRLHPDALAAFDQARKNFL